MNKYLLVVALGLLLVGCKARKSTSLRFDATQKAYAAAWKSDPLGCQGIRTDPMGAALAEAILNDPAASPETIVAWLGDPEYTQVRNGHKAYGYYYGGECADGTIPDGAVYCVLEFFFESDGQTLYEAGVVCG